jgi:hypothetical protein
VAAGRAEAEVWAVAGCLFEVHLPRPQDGAHWCWVRATPFGHGAGDAPVTLLGEHPADEPEDTCRLRFRAERPGQAVLTFERGPEVDPVHVTVSIAPERLAGEGA